MRRKAAVDEYSTSLVADPRRLAADPRRLGDAPRRLASLSSNSRTSEKYDQRHDSLSRRSADVRRGRSHGRPRSPRRVSIQQAPPKLNHNQNVAPSITLAPSDSQLNVSLFSDIRALQPHIQKAAYAEAARLTPGGSSSSRYGYGPPKLTPNTSAEPTPQSNATTRPAMPHIGE